MTDGGHLPARVTPERPEVSVVVPVYNGAATLPELVARLGQVLPQCCRRFEVVLVNDGSADDSWQVIRGLAGEQHWVRGINLARNYGQHNALFCGIRSARYEALITLDDDLQNPPEEIPQLLQKLAEGHDVVYGMPDHEQHGLFRDLASQITKMVLRTAMGADIARNVSAFRAFRKSICVAFDHYRGSFVNLDILLTWGTRRFAAIRIRHDPRRKGVSGYSLGKLIAHASNMITGFSVLPLQVASLIGFAFTFVGVLVLLYAVGRYLLQGTAVPGFPFLASIIAIFSGAELFALGVIGEYLARMHFRSMERPPYAVQEATSSERSTIQIQTYVNPFTISRQL